MRLQTEVVVPGIEDAQKLEVEVADNVISFYLHDSKKADFMMDFEGNFDEFIIAIMKVWGNWSEGKKTVVDESTSKEGQ